MFAVLLLVTLSGCKLNVPVFIRQRLPFPQDALAYSLNHKTLSSTNQTEFTFLVTGHIYGSHAEDASRPAKNLLDQLPALSEAQPAMFVSLGDIVINSSADDFDQLEKNFFSRLNYPVFNTVGNHDVEDRALYEERFGKTIAGFRYGPAYFIFLDTQQEMCRINGEQENQLVNTVNRAVKDSQVRNIFIFMHNVIFVEDDILKKSKNPAVAPNEWICYHNNNYQELRDLIFLPAARVKPVYLFAGDVGAWNGNLSPFYQKDTEADLTLVAAGIGDTPLDVVLSVAVNQEKVTFEVKSLTGLEFGPLEKYNLAFWQQAAATEGTPTP
jgi:hypothetical protein